MSLFTDSLSAIPVTQESYQLFGFTATETGGVAAPIDDVNAKLMASGGNLREKLGPLIIGLTQAQHESRTRWVLTLGLPSIAGLRDKWLGQHVVIVGGGSSLDIEKIRAARAAGKAIAAVNKSHDWLIRYGLVPDFALMVDPAMRHAGYMTPHPDVTYLFGSILHPKVWQRFSEAGVDPYVWIPAYSYGQDVSLKAAWPDAEMCIIAGVTTIGFRSVNVLAFLGFQTIGMYGVDSCYAPGQDGTRGSDTLYAYSKPLIQHDTRRIVITSSRTGRKLRVVTNGAMAFQLLGFASTLKSLPTTEVNGRLGKVRLLIGGDGAIPWMAWQDGGAEYVVAHADPDAMRAKYGDAQEYDYQTSAVVVAADQKEAVSNAA